MRYASSIGSSSGMAGGLLGGDYRFFFTKNFGLGLGVEVSFYNAKGVIDDYSYAELTRDYEGSDFEFRTNLRNYGERESIVMVNIPLMFRYRGDPERNMFYAAAGAKIGIPVAGKYRVVEGTSSNSGYYGFEDEEYTTQTFMGFGSFPEIGDQEIKLKPTVMLSVEAGMNWRLQYILIYTGIYIDYGLKNVVEKSNELIATYNSRNPTDRHMGSMLSAQYIEEGNRTHITKDVLPVAIGLKVGITFGHGRKKESYTTFDHPPVFNRK